jgi:hypothetical protein
MSGGFRDALLGWRATREIGAAVEIKRARHGFGLG